MNCLACGTTESRVSKSYDDGVEIRRMRNCPCGARWSTTETSEKRTLVTTNGQGPPLITRNQPSVATGSRGGVGGGLSSDLSSLSLSPDLSDLSPGSDQGVDRARGDGPLEYPPAFELVWEETGRHGVKFKALKAWLKTGRPTWDAIGSVWGAYLLSERPRAGFIQDLSTWLNGRGHTQSWEVARGPVSRSGSAYQQTIDSMQGFLARHEGED